MGKLTKRNSRFPKSPPTDDIDHIAAREFDHLISPRWLNQQPLEDKGCDRVIEIKEGGELKGRTFKVQIKGTERPSYDKSQEHISCPLKVTTINYLTAHSPGMLCVCAVSEEGRPIYWVWLQEFIKTLERTNLNWIDQGSVTVNIPTSQILNGDSFDSIERYVSLYYDDVSINTEIGRIIAEPLGLAESHYQPLSLRARSIIAKRAAPYLQNLGLIDICSDDKSIELRPLSKSDQVLLKILKESSGFLESLEDRKAEEILRRIARKIGPARESLKARYFNNVGILAFHIGDLKKALQYFKRASQLEQSEKKYIVNLLSAEFYLALSLSDIRKYLPKSWTKRLEEILKKHRSYHPVIFLKSHYLSKLGLYDEALGLIKSSSAWKKRNLEAYIAIAGIFIDMKSYEDLVNLFATIKNKSAAEDPFYWSILADAHLAMALGDEPHGFELMGPGPASINFSSLNKAEACYAHAWELFKQRGFPKLSEQTFENYSASLILLGEYPKCDKICSVFLEHNPNSIGVIENYIAVLNFQNNNILSLKAVDYAKRAYAIKPASSRVYENLILALFICDYYDQVINYVLEREKSGFNDNVEEGLSRSLLAQSYDAMGKNESCEEQLTKLENIPGLFIDYCLTKAEIYKRRARSSKDIIDILKSAPKNLEDDRILAKIISILLPINKINAEEIVRTILDLAKIRQLTPEEYSVFGKAYLELAMPNEAYDVFRRGSIRYPNDIRFLYLCAMAAFEEGNDRDAFICLEQYLDKSEKDYSILKNVALLARRIGKLEESITFFERALNKAAEPYQRAELHCLLYEVKKALSKPPKDLLRHANEYGKLISKENKEDEVRYLLMFFLVPLGGEPEKDPELTSWISYFQERLRAFLKQNPDCPSLRVFHIPEDTPNSKKGEYIINQLAYITLPQRLAVAPFELAIKSQPWPLAFRAQVISGTGSIFNYWTRCVTSKEYSHGIHIWGLENDIELEAEISKTKEIMSVQDRN